MIEMFIFGVLILTVFIVNNQIDTEKFIKDNKKTFNLLKEDDFDFLVAAKYGDGVDPNALFERRIKYGLFVLIGLFLGFLTKLSLINIVIILGVSFLIFKLDYLNLKSYHKKHLHEINLLLPYYLKSLEILIQHYTIPVAITKSVEDAPPIFKDGLKELISSIDAGDSSINPYMAFAIRYPVRDSMRMMRLLYRLSLGKQERKQEQLVIFSRTISNLQAKSREIRYKERLSNMEKRTLAMLVGTGGGVLVILLLAIMQMFQM